MQIEVVQLRSVRILAAATRLITATEVGRWLHSGFVILIKPVRQDVSHKITSFFSDASLCHGSEQYPDPFLF